MTVNVTLSAIDDLSEAVKEIVAQQLTAPRWYTLKAACEFKGVSYNTVKCSALLQPGCGKEDATINGRKMWRAETVVAWCDVTDDNLGEYVKACRDGRQGGF